MYTPDFFCFVKDVGNEQRYMKYIFLHNIGNFQ